MFMDLEEYTNPEDLIKQANVLLDEGRWSDARQFLSRALEMNDKNADVYALLGWAIYKDDPTGRNMQEAEQTIKKGIKLDPKRYLHYLYLGKIYAAAKQRDFAELHFVKALELNVECTEAKEEIKRMYHR
jgi:Tfp pilus assembly protein PilF